MNTTAAFPPVPSTIPTPKRSTDVFDFLHGRQSEPSDESAVKVQEVETSDGVAVTVAMADGRTVRRKVSSECWKEQGYRQAMIRSMCMLIA